MNNPPIPLATANMANHGGHNEISKEKTPAEDRELQCKIPALKYAVFAVHAVTCQLPNYKGDCLDFFEFRELT